MNEPTLTVIPGILLRTIFRAIARGLLLAAGLFLLIGLCFVWCSFLLVTFRTARGPRTQAMFMFLNSAFSLYKSFEG